MQLKESIKDVLIQIDDPAFSEEHNRLLKLPAEHYQKFSSLKKHFGSKTTDNEICRFLTAKSYEFEETKKTLENYH